MSRIIRLLLPIALVVIAAQRLPAPISEEATTPKPQPKREATPKPKPRAQATPKPKPSPNQSFAGNWTGSGVSTNSNGDSGNYVYLIKISDDEKTVWINWNKSGNDISGAGYQAPCNRFGGTLTWSLTFPDSIVTDTLRINPDGTASFVENGRFTSGDYEGVTFNINCVLSRQGVTMGASPPQTTTTAPAAATASAQSSGVPTAKPVPSKPGFVYNPFDPNSRVLLDVRSKASGTKVKDPFSGKLFIVP